MTGAELREIRARFGQTQVQFADAMGVAPNTVARWERDELRIPRTAAKLARALVELDGLRGVTLNLIGQRVCLAMARRR